MYTEAVVAPSGGLLYCGQESGWTAQENCISELRTKVGLRHKTVIIAALH